MSAARATGPGWIDDAIAELRPLCTVTEATDVLRMSRRNFYRLVSSGRIHAVKAVESGSSRLLVPRVAIERYLRSLEGS